MTGICVTYNTEALLRRAYESIRRHHPFLDIILVDGSDANDPCYALVRKLAGQHTKIFQTGYNIGHGNGLHFGIEHCTDDELLLFDSDICMLRSPLAGMLGMLAGNVYGVGWITEVGLDGHDYGTWAKHKEQQPIKYLHPYFALINRAQYFKFHRFVHHGAPFYKAMIDIHRHGLSDKILLQFPGLTGHTSGRGVNWIGRPSPYIQHDFGGTRAANKRAGKKEIPGQWL